MLFAGSVLNRLPAAGETAQAPDPPGITLSGKTVARDGSPLADAKVVLCRVLYGLSDANPIVIELQDEQTTDENGAFSLQFQGSGEGQCMAMIAARRQGLGLGWKNVAIGQNPHDQAGLEVTLRPPARLAGKVVDADGAPIAGAEVRCLLASGNGAGPDAWLMGLAPFEWLTAVTDARGDFAFDNIPEDAAGDFLATAVGRAATCTLDVQRLGQRPSYTAGRTDVQIVLPAEARVEGAVTDMQSGKPVAGLVVVAKPVQYPLPYLYRSCVSGADGAFAVSGLSEGQYTLTIAPPFDTQVDWVTVPVTVTTQAGAVEPGVKVQVTRGGILEVAITAEADGKPIPQAHVAVAGDNTGQHVAARTGDDGVASVRLPPGAYRIGWIYHHDYLHKALNETAGVELGKTSRVDVVMSGKPVVRGVVLDTSGEPVEGALVRVLPHGRQESRSGADGAFTVSFEPAAWGESTIPLLFARHEGRGLAATVEFETEAKSVDLRLEPGCTVSGRVVDPDGKPVKGAQVRPMLCGDRWRTSIPHGPVETDTDGRYELKALPRDQRYSVAASADGYGQSQADVAFAGPGAARGEAEDIVLALADRHIAGSVVDLDDKPVAGARIWLHGTGQPSRQGTSGKDGTFRIDGICAGTVDIQASVPGSNERGSVRADAGDEDVQLVIGQSATYSPPPPRLAPSLVGKPLPDLQPTGVELAPEHAQGQRLLVCLWDTFQRPSRHCVGVLAERAAWLQRNGVTAVAVHASPVEAAVLRDWTDRLGASFANGMLKDAEESAREAWGARGLPWLILTDRDHVVRAEGFDPSEIEQLLTAP